MSRNRPVTTPQIPALFAKGCGTLFLSIFAVAGLIGTFFLGRAVLDNLRVYTWKVTPCTVVQSERVVPGLEKTDSETDRGIVLKYRYESGGKSYTSGTIQPGIASEQSWQDSERLLLNYPAGAVASCWVNPSDPSASALQRPPVWPVALLLMPLIFVLVGIGGMIALWRARKPGTRPIARKNSGFNQKMFGIAFGSIFLCVGLAVLTGLTIVPLLKVQAAKSWPEVPCVITSSEVDSHRGSKGGTTYSVKISFAYQVGGREFRSDRYGFASGSSSGRQGKEAIVQGYPVGRRTVCYVNPEDPTEAVLNRGIVPMIWFGLFSLIFIIVGLGVMIGMVRSASASGTKLPRRTSPSGSPVLPAATGGSMELKASSSPMGKLIGAVFFAVIWNGIIGVFVAMAVRSWMMGRFKWLMALFLIPFVLIGILIIVYACRAFLNLFNPRIRLSVPSGSFALGAQVALSWAFHGAASRIQRLRIRLEGHEEATYRRGTNSHTDRQVFADLVIADVTDPGQIANGRGQVEIPAGLMHTWASRNNKIVWTIKVAGEIPRFPDVEEEYEVMVLPQGQS